MALRGELSTMLLPDVLQWLSQGLKTGILHIRSPKGIAKKVYFKNGNILSTASSDPREYFGQFLISRGFINEKQLNMAMETQLKTGIKLGKVLLMVGILDEADLVATLRLKAEECLYELFLWEDGEFVFEELPEIAEDLVLVSLDVTSLVLEGIRRTDEWGRIRQVIPSTRVVLARKGRLSDLKGELPGFEMRILDEIDGAKSLEEIALELHTSEFNICQEAYFLYQKGLVAFAKEKQSSDEKGYEAVQLKIIGEAQKLLDQEKFQETINLLKFYLKHDNPEPIAQELLKKAETLYSQKFLKVTLPPDSVLELSIPLEELSKQNLTPKEGYLVTRINGSWDLSSIIKVSPLPETEVLLGVQKLLDLGIVKIKKKK
jgi:hypothetical protein